MLEGISDGKYIIKEMGLSKFKEIVVQKVLNIPQSFFIITIDSRYPNIHIPYQKLKKIKSSYIIKLNRKGDSVTPTEYKMTPPVDLRNAKLSISLGSTIMVRDLAGDYLMNDKMYESVEVGKIQKIKGSVTAFTEGQYKSLMAVKDMVIKNGATYCNTLDEVASYVNSNLK